MAKITIDGQQYDSEKLSADALTQIESLRFVDAEIVRKQNELAVLQTARVAYAKALVSGLPAKETKQ